MKDDELEVPRFSRGGRTGGTSDPERDEQGGHVDGAQAGRDASDPGAQQHPLPHMSTSPPQVGGSVMSQSRTKDCLNNARKEMASFHRQAKALSELGDHHRIHSQMIGRGLGYIRKRSNVVGAGEGASEAAPAAGPGRAATGGLEGEGGEPEPPVRTESECRREIVRLGALVDTGKMMRNDPQSDKWWEGGRPWQRRLEKMLLSHGALSELGDHHRIHSQMIGRGLGYIRKRSNVVGAGEGASEAAPAAGPGRAATGGLEGEGGEPEPPVRTESECRREIVRLGALVDTGKMMRNDPQSDKWWEGGRPWQRRLEKMLLSHGYSMLIVALLVIDVVLVGFELLAVEGAFGDTHGHTVHEIEHVVHWMSVTILAYLNLDVLLHLLAMGVRFFHNWGYITDLIVAPTSLALEIFFAGVGGVIIILRLWRLVRIAHGVAIVQLEQFEHKFRKLLEIAVKLDEQIHELEKAHREDEEEEMRRSQGAVSITEDLLPNDPADPNAATTKKID
uniref:Hydrogen voltage-gated channel 1 n=1 Tax=Chromera velia CCMP2878 TaxID=1169474 RepID=A0A0G4I9T2_9ALVE|eukprot:Cvel_12366.t1-p1 / transcript=Cvel_12366.t1 / gene=Cvel_12366 / organism=Chromera_velia_CCMP2878 / gene_product=hypothetical protein / transcript_product=hypothetical protein / location=Cvel_scaffold806:27622-30595(+) / protein_length=504 / sequence_SO=supercontig / SO=protein_coding / is_pseudo=false